LNVFFDSSALAKRYIEEKGSDQVQAILSSAAALAVSVICVPEIVSALCRLRRERKLSTEEYRNAKASVLTDVDDATVIGITEEVIAHGVALLEQFSLRSADALHIACALEWTTDPRGVPAWTQAVRSAGFNECSMAEPPILLRGFRKPHQLQS
jgi:uncharacterized protein